MFRWEMRTIINWLIVAAIVWFIFKNPTGAAAEVHKFFGFLSEAMNSIITFFNTVFS